MLPRATSPEERRVHPRSEYRGVLHLQCLGETTWFGVHGIDVSAGGFAFMSDYEMKRGEQVAVAVEEVPGQVIWATVRWARPQPGGFLVGIEFDESLPPEVERVLCT
jgi:PilZ domain